MTGLTTLVAHPLGVGFVILPPPLLEDLVKAFDDKCHFLIVELGGVDGEPTSCTLFFLLFRRLECDGLYLGFGGCWGPSASEGPQKQDLTVFLEYNV
jgi:hypothetical protein